MEQIIFDCFIAYYGLVFIFDIGFAVDTDFFLFGIQLWHQQNKVSAYFAWCMILWSYEGGEEDIGREGKQKIIGPSRSKALKDKSPSYISWAFT